MITAVDTSVLLDVFLADDQHGPRSKALLRNAYDRGAILICDVVYAELVPAFDDRATSTEHCGRSARRSHPDTDIAYEAGSAGRATGRPAGPEIGLLPDRCPRDC